MDSYRFILSGGGTGGHIYPAIAIANELKKRYPSSEILFVGAKDKMEMEKVPQAGYKIKGLWISGLQRKLTLKNLMFPFKVLSSLLSARKIIKQFKPSLVVGTGGYASGPLVKMASSAGIPSVLQEQNSYAGITNKMLSKNAQKICVAYDDMDQFFPKDKIVKTGNPVRSDLVSIKDSKKASAEFFALNPNQTTLLVLGGSLGARMINQLIKNELEFFKNHGVQVLWQCGKLYHNDYLKFESDRVKITPFITDMAKAYALADIIVSRAGAGSVSELCLVGKPTIFIPSPNVAEDHQTKNALALVEKDAAMMVKESELEQKFEAEFEALLGSKEKQIKLSNNIKKLALPKATEHIVNEIEKLLKWI